MTSRRSVPSQCSDLSTNKSMSSTFGYIGEVFLNKHLTSEPHTFVKNLNSSNSR